MSSFESLASSIKILMTKRKRNFFLIIVTSGAILLLFVAAVLVPAQKPSGPQQITMPYNLSFTTPSGWTIYKKPMVNQLVFTNEQKKDNLCYLDMFVVRPDRDYSFNQWLGTAISNQTFLQNGNETTFKDKNMFIGSYSFVDDYFREPVNNQRAILKGGGTLLDMHMSYKTNASCPKDFTQILDSMNF